jgi:hypothetical protein
MVAKSEMLTELRMMLRELFQARQQGATYTRYARAHGYVDGFMRALLESGITTKDELVALVAAERVAVHGPAVAHPSPEVLHLSHRLFPKEVSPCNKMQVPKSVPELQCFSFRLVCNRSLIAESITRTNNQGKPIVPSGIPFRCAMLPNRNVGTAHSSR